MDTPLTGIYRAAIAFMGRFRGELADNSGLFCFHPSRKHAVSLLLRKLAPLAALVVFLGGCATLDQRLDALTTAHSVAVPPAWTASVKTSRPADAGDFARWWRQFGDPLLEQLIDEALTAAPDLRNAQARLRQARATRDLAESNLYPSLGVSAGATRSRTGIEAGGGNQSQTLYSAGFDASWEPSIFGGLRDAATGAEADAAAMAATLDATRASLAAEVALEYVTLRASQQRLAIARANVASQAETLQIAEWRELAGLVTALDVAQARTNLEQTRASIPVLENSLAATGNRLALLTGRPPGSLRDTLQGARPLLAAPEAIAVGIPSDTLRQRPDVQAAELTLRAEIARTAEREADLYPTLTLSGSLGWKALGVSALGGSDGLVRSLAASLATTLFDGGRIRSRIAVQNAVQEQALIAWEKSVLTALEDVENALSAYATGRERTETRRRGAESAATAAELARAQYQAGLTDFQSVLETERTLLTAQDNLASAEADVLTAVIQLYKALGGGWQAVPVTTESEKS